MPEPWVAGISLLFVACSFSLDLPEKKGDERRRESESVREREREGKTERDKKKRGCQNPCLGSVLFLLLMLRISLLLSISERRTEERKTEERV